MKWKDTDFKSGIDKIRAVLIYGPDIGQVDEYCDLAIEKLGIEKLAEGCRVGVPTLLDIAKELHKPGRDPP